MRGSHERTGGIDTGHHPDDPEDVIAQIIGVRRSLRRRLTERSHHPLLELNLTMPQLKVLVTLESLGATPGQELARRTGAALPTLTGIVDRLVAAGLVQRREDPRDRRVRLVELTAKGADQIRRLISDGEDRERRLLRRLELPQLEVVAEAHRLLLAAAEQELADDLRSAVEDLAAEG
jgi:DNA-binding MarR family transcriptional regulator